MTPPKKILLLSKYPRLGASSRLRSIQYLPYLEANGFEVTIKSLFDEKYLNDLYIDGRRSKARTALLYAKRFFVLFKAIKYDLIWVEYEIFPYTPPFAEKILRLFGKKYVVDYDDAIFHNYDLSNNPLIKKILGRKIDGVMRSAHSVIAGNNYLSERAKLAGAENVMVIPTVVDHTRYQTKEKYNSTPLIIGWVGSPSTQKYVVGIREALAKVCQAHGARLMLVGATPQIAAELPGIDVEAIPWTESSEAALIHQMDIGIMPLLDGPWEKGKCGYKLIQYMACAVPVIASPIGVNIDIVTTSRSGLLADTSLQWEDALLRLMSSPELRAELGKAGRIAVENNYSLQSQSPILSELFTKIIKQSRD